jgi:hypothetical protein
VVACNAFLLASPLRSIVSAAVPSALFDDFIANMEDSDCSESCIIGYDSSSSRRGPAAELMANSELSRLPDKERIHMPAPTTTQSWTRTRDFARTHVAFRQVQRRRRSELITTFRGSISRPVYAPTDASPPVSRPTAHGLGSIWFAKPCIVRDFHSVFFASFSGASGRVVKPLASLVRPFRLFSFS